MSTTEVKLSDIADVKLKNAKGEVIVAKELWKSQAAVVYVLRRPGCILCRAEAKRLWQGLKPQLDSLRVGLTCVAHQWIETEIKAFNVPEYWGGDVWLDEDKAFFKALGGGAVRRGNLLHFLNPVSRVWKHVGEAFQVGVPESNLWGDGLTMGGLMVLRPGEGGVEYAFVEETFGDHPDHDVVLEAAKAAAGKA